MNTIKSANTIRSKTSGLIYSHLTPQKVINVLDEAYKRKKAVVIEYEDNTGNHSIKGFIVMSHYKDYVSISQTKNSITAVILGWDSITITKILSGKGKAVLFNSQIM